MRPLGASWPTATATAHIIKHCPESTTPSRPKSKACCTCLRHVAQLGLDGRGQPHARALALQPLKHALQLDELVCMWQGRGEE